MDKRIGWNRARFLDENRIIGVSAINMRIVYRRIVTRTGILAMILIVLWAVAIGPEPPGRIIISPDELVRAARFGAIRLSNYV